MILLDTNIISELWKVEPNPNVLNWVDAQTLETLYLSAITVAELRYGIAIMPEGKRRTVFQERLDKEVLPAFAGRILAFDVEVSQVYAHLMANARFAGKAISAADGYIAATAATHKLIVATRDTLPFENLGLEVLNPFFHFSLHEG